MSKALVMLHVCLYFFSHFMLYFSNKALGMKSLLLSSIPCRNMFLHVQASNTCHERQMIYCIVQMRGLAAQFFYTTPVAMFTLDSQGKVRHSQTARNT